MATFFSPDFNLLDYYFWNEVKEKVYSGHDTKYFETEKELKDKMFSTYDQCVTNVEPLGKARKQLLPCLKDVTKGGRPIQIVSA